jgi:hypothetical protein
MLTLDRPSLLSSPDYRRLYCEEREPPEYVAWVRRYGPAIAAAWENAPPALDAKDYDALHAAADAVARAEERAYRECWL